MATIKALPVRTRRPRESTVPSPPGESRFFRVGDGLFQSSAGSCRIRFHDRHSFTLRVIRPGDRAVYHGLDREGLVFLRDARGLIAQARSLWSPGGARVQWRNFSPVGVPEQPGAEMPPVTVRYSPNTRHFSTEDARLAGRFNPENGRIRHGPGSATRFEGLVGPGFVVLCLGAGPPRVYACSQTAAGNFNLHGLHADLEAASLC